MKNALLVIVLAMASSFAWASGINFTNQFGSATVTDAGIFSHGVQLESYNGVHAKPGHSLGSVVFSTGALVSGSVLAGGTFSNVGSVFDIFGNGKGVHHGAIFTGSFSGPIVWTLLSHVGQTYNFSLVGTLAGSMWNGRSVTGTTTQYLTLFKNQWVVDHKGNIGLGGGGLTTPEPGTLSLLGTGLATLAGAFWRKLCA
jgi:PEP-CTERM motif-containing protein